VVPFSCARAGTDKKVTDAKAIIAVDLMTILLVDLPQSHHDKVAGSINTGNSMPARVMCFTVSTHISFTLFTQYVHKYQGQTCGGALEDVKQVSAIFRLRNAHKICASQGAGRQARTYCAPGQRVLPLSQAGLAVCNINAFRPQTDQQRVT